MVSLDLSNNFIGSVGFTSIANFLADPINKLVKLYVHALYFDISNGSSSQPLSTLQNACTLIESLRHNKTLKVLSLWDEKTIRLVAAENNMTCYMVAFGEISFLLENKLLCDTSSIDACITSNHSLASLGLSAAQLMQEGSALNQLIEINASAGLNRHEKAREKLRAVYFMRDFEMKQLIDLELACMPHVFGLLTHCDEDRVEASQLNQVFRVIRQCVGTIISV